MRRKPVRYIRKAKSETCEICGRAADQFNPFPNAHKISFDLGIIKLALTPEFLDGDSNIATAHRARCNKGAELDLENSMRFLHSIGVTELPTFVAEEVHSLWVRLGLN